MEGARHVPWVGQSRSGLPCNDDIAADVNNKCDLRVQAPYSRQEWLVRLTTCKLQSEKFTGLIYGENEGPPFYTEDNYVPPKARSCSYQASLHLTEPVLPVKCLLWLPQHCYQYYTWDVPITAIIASVTPIMTLVTTSIVITFTLNSRNKCYTSLYSPCFSPKALWHNTRGKA